MDMNRPPLSHLQHRGELAEAAFAYVSDGVKHSESRAAEAAFAYVSDGVKHSDWTLGSMDRKALGDNLFTGTSMFDRSQGYIRLRTDPENLMVYADIGPSPDRLVPEERHTGHSRDQRGSRAERVFGYSDDVAGEGDVRPDLAPNLLFPRHGNVHHQEPPRAGITKLLHLPRPSAL